MKVQIIVDSTVDMPEHSRSACRVVPLTVHFGEESFIDGVTLNKQDFYRRAGGGRRAAHYQPGHPRCVSVGV